MHSIYIAFQIRIVRLLICLFVFPVTLLTPFRSHAQLKVCVAGLTHDHVRGLMNDYKKAGIIILGIAEKNKELVRFYKERNQLPDSIFYDDISNMLQKQKPDAVLAYNATAEHLATVQACAPLGISVMVEKPLATTMKDAEAIAILAKRYKIQVLTNYETTWYPSNQEIGKRIQEENTVGPIRKMVVHDGHGGPKEIGVSTAFLDWLTDPVLNGGGALYDFGCYGANLMTWLMKGEKPIAVTAITKQIKPAVYPKVDDDATILVEYKDATGIIEASWNWPYGIKDMEVFGTNGYLQAVDRNKIRSRLNNANDYSITDGNALEKKYADNISYLAAVLKGEIESKDDLSSLSNNLIVVKILEAARQSAKEGKRIVLQ